MMRVACRYWRVPGRRDRKQVRWRQGVLLGGVPGTAPADKAVSEDHGLVFVDPISFILRNSVSIDA